jgi:hypothetical protein
LCSPGIGDIRFIRASPISQIDLGIDPAATNAEIRIQAALRKVHTPHQGHTPDHIEHDGGDPEPNLRAGVDDLRQGSRDVPYCGAGAGDTHVEATGFIGVNIGTENVVHVELEPEKRQRV